MTLQAVRPIPLLDLKTQYATIRDEVRAAMDRVVESQQFILGPDVEAFEDELAEYCGTAHAVGVSSGSDALLISLMAAGIGVGDEVITTAYSFFASAGAIARVGARPVFVDISADDYNIDPERVEAAVTSRTRALLPVHLFGQTADMDPIMDLAAKHGLLVIEDAAQAIGAEYRGRRAGSIGDFGCFSFFPSKNLGGFGDGGIVTTDAPNLAERLRLLRGHGAKPKYHSRTIGGNFRLDTLQAAVLRVKLRHLDEWTAGRRRNADRYRSLLGGLPTQGERSVSPPTDVPQRKHVYNQFVVRTPGRESLRAYLSQAQIGSEVYYPIPLHLMDAFGSLGHSLGEFPLSEGAASESLALPIYAELTEDMQQRVVDTIREWQQMA